MTKRKKESKGELAHLLRNARGTATQAELARASGVSDRTISAIELGTTAHQPKPETIAKLALATGQDPHAWLRSVGQELSEAHIEDLGKEVAALVKVPDLRPADAILTEVETLIDHRLAIYDPPDKIRAALQVDIETYLTHRLRDIRPASELKEHIISDAMRLIDKRFDGLEPASELKRHLYEYVDGRVAYIDLRVTELRNVLQDFAHRLDYLSNFCNDLSRRTSDRINSAALGADKE